MDTPAEGNTSNSDRGIPASVSPGHLRALSEVLRQTRKPPAKLELEAIRKAAADSPTLAGLSPGTPAQIHRGLRNLQLINAADEPTQAYLQLLSGNTDADWKDFIDAHFDYLLNDEVSLLDLTSKELNQRLAEQHPDTGKSTLAGTARLIRGMMTRSFEQPADENATRPLPQQKQSRVAATAQTAAPASPEPVPAKRKNTRQRRSPASQQATGAASTPVPPALPTTIVDVVEPASTAASTTPTPREQDTAAPAAQPPATQTATRTRRKRAASAPTADNVTLEVPLSGSITLPLGGNNAATLSWSLSTLDANSISVVESQLEIARQFLEAVKENAS